MPVLKNVVGLDLGSHSLKAVEFRQTLRGLDAVQLRSLPRPPEAPLQELVAHFAELHRFSRDHVVTALAGDRLSARRVSLPVTERRRLAQAVPFAIEEELPFDLDDVVIDWDLIGIEGSRSEVLAVVAPRGEVSTLLGELGAANCAPRTLEAGGLVLANLCAVFDLPGRRLLADLGHRTSSFCVIADEKPIASRTVPIGGADVTEALASDRGLTPQDAERAKFEEGVFGSSFDQVGPQTGKVLDRLAREVVRTLGGVEGVTGGAGIEHVTLFGGNSLLDRIDLFLSERCGVEASRLPLPREDRGAGLVAGGPPVLYAPAIALALRGTGWATTKLNFRRDEFAVRFDLGQTLRDFRSTLWLGAAALLLALVSFGTAGFLEGRQVRALEERTRRLYTEAFAGKAAPADPVGAMRAELASAQDRADFLGVYRGNLSALDVLTEISARVPDNLDLALEELSIDKQTVRMRVSAKNFQTADRLKAELAKYPPFGNPKVGAIERDPRTQATRFTLTISLKELEAAP